MIKDLVAEIKSKKKKTVKIIPSHIDSSYKIFLQKDNSNIYSLLSSATPIKTYSPHAHP